jgi:hypothetical protein
MAHDQEVVGSNPSTIYWLDVSDLLAITLKKKVEIKSSQMGHIKKKFKSLGVYKVIAAGRLINLFVYSFGHSKLTRFGFKISHRNESQTFSSKK